VNALADDRVADYINDHFAATFLKVGTFRIVNGQKQGGNVATYFCLADGSVLHAVAGQVGANTLLSEARWVVETRKAALTRATNLVTGQIDMAKYKATIKQAHEERFAVGPQGNLALVMQQDHKFNLVSRLPASMPGGVGQQAQVHWLLATNPLAAIDSVYPIVWQRILRERLSGLPVAVR
jgi:hypothetical protein